RAAAQLLQEDFGVVADVRRETSLTEIARNGQPIQRWNMLHPNDKPQESYVARCLDGMPGPVVASTDYIRLYAEQIRPYLSRTYRVLGTDGFGRSDTRQKLRHFFEVDRYYVAVAALDALAEDGKIERSKVVEALTKYGIDADKPDPARS